MPFNKNVTTLHIKLSFKPLKHVYGWYHSLDGNHCEIEIKRGAAQLEQLETIYHEIQHFICDLLKPDNCVKFLNIRPARPARRVHRGRYITTLAKTQSQEEKLCYQVANSSIKLLKKYLKP
jgi:hypothetical protein